MLDTAAETKTQLATNAETLQRIRDEIHKVIVGQDALIDRLLLAMLCNGHVLIEGVPGLAKTLLVTTLANCLQTAFHRIQFTPDLLPGDLIGTMTYNPQTGDFTPHKGPIFSNIILADEINRSPAKVQSALLEAMQEHQVTIGNTTYPLSEPFFVLATQNPIEQEGTYPLPEAQVDRFMFKLHVTYPGREAEHAVLKRMARSAPPVKAAPVATAEDILAMRATLDDVFMDEKVEHYILDLVQATRTPKDVGLELEGLIRYGASPRATIFLALAARGNALLAGRDYVTPEDVKSLATDILRHRVIITYEAEAEGMSADDLLARILEAVDVP